MIVLVLAVIVQSVMFRPTDINQNGEIPWTDKNVLLEMTLIINITKGLAASCQEDQPEADRCK